MRRDDRGAVAAEFAVVVPAVVLVVALTAGTLSASGRQVRLEQAAAQAARVVARGEGTDRAAAVVASIAGAASVSIHADGDLMCAEVVAAVPLPLPLPPLRAASCALSDGR
ncbi:TadE family type IV pilus minor pilin [Microbacterium sp.]|uniref:TadE family type IV pilus minor pilin n=1 Tax=Microbacterium sp. TaxID=51671 RepID=UPI0025F76CDB|nr:TadE family type IV pilus minor pilin [Microbacterium sp.]